VDDVWDELVEAYAAWWIDILGEHNHIGGLDSTQWLWQRSGLNTGDRALDVGAFVGGTARFLASNAVGAVALDVGRDFMAAGSKLEGGAAVSWVEGIAQKLPFKTGAFRAVFCMDSYIAPVEFARVTAGGGAVCLCCEVPVDSRGGLDAFIDEWAGLGFELASHKQLSLEATQQWRSAEAELVRRRPYFQGRYGERPYIAQLDIVGDLVRVYERGEMGHGLFVFRKG
jgi:hypothetical protein